MATTDWTKQATELFNSWSEGQKKWLESFAWPSAAESNASAFAGGVTDAATVHPPWKPAVDAWTHLLRQGSRIVQPHDALRNLIDPAQWAKPMPGSFDFGIERVIEGPTFATLWDLDRKLL